MDEIDTTVQTGGDEPASVKPERPVSTPSSEGAVEVPAAESVEKPAKKSATRRRTTKKKAASGASEGSAEGGAAAAEGETSAGEQAAEKPAKKKSATRRRTTKKKASLAETEGSVPEAAKPADAPETAKPAEPAAEAADSGDVRDGSEEAPASGTVSDAKVELTSEEYAEEAAHASRSSRRRRKSHTVHAQQANAEAHAEGERPEQAREGAEGDEPAVAPEDGGEEASREGRHGSRRDESRRLRTVPVNAGPGESADSGQVRDGVSEGEREGAAEAAEGQHGGAVGAEGLQQDQETHGGEGQEQGGENRGKSGKRRRNRRNRNNKQRKEIVPSATRDELAAMSDEELGAKATQLGVDPIEYGERDDLVSAVYDALLQSEGFVMVEGILDLLPDGYGFIRTDGYLPGEHDVYVGMSMVRRNGLRKGDYVTGRVRPPRENEKYPALNTITTLNNAPFDGPTHRVKFANLTPIYPDERLVLEHGKDSITARAIDLVSPIGKGQRGLIVSPPKAGKTTVLKDIAAAISANNPEVHLMCLLVDERPEEVTDMERSIDGEVISSTFDMPCENHIAVAELVIERAKRLVENGQDVVILLDSITRLARAYNLNQPASGRILSGGVDSTALYPPKRFLGAARNIENGGSLTILGTALIDTGSKMDEVIFEEFKGTGNMELKLDRNLADKRIFPAIDPVASSTRKDELLVDPQEAPLVWGLRRLLANMNNTERAMKMLIQSLKQTETNREFLVKSARKANRASDL